MSERGFERLVNFSDAVVAIALTLLVLPLVDVASDIGGDSISEIFSEHSDQFVAFLLSFAVIALFWVAHHRVFDWLAAANYRIVWWNFLWLLGIVFLPFPTAIIALHGSNVGPVSVYIATLLVSAFALRMISREARLHPELLTEVAREGQSTYYRVLGGWLTCLLMAIALLLAVTIPGAGTFPLLLLLLDGPIEAWALRRHKRLLA